MEPSQVLITKLPLNFTLTFLPQTLNATQFTLPTSHPAIAPPPFDATGHLQDVAELFPIFLVVTWSPQLREDYEFSRPPDMIPSPPCLPEHHFRVLPPRQAKGHRLGDPLRGHYCPTLIAAGHPSPPPSNDHATLTDNPSTFPNQNEARNRPPCQRLTLPFSSKLLQPPALTLSSHRHISLAEPVLTVPHSTSIQPASQHWQ